MPSGNYIDQGIWAMYEEYARVINDDGIAAAILTLATVLQRSELPETVRRLPRDE